MMRHLSILYFFHFLHLKSTVSDITVHFPYQEVKVFCNCLRPKTYGDMIQCDECEEWSLNPS